MLSLFVAFLLGSVRLRWIVICCNVAFRFAVLFGGVVAAVVVV